MSTGHPLPPPGPADLVKPAGTISNQGLGVSGLNYWKRLGWKISLLSAHQSLIASLVVVPLMLWFMMSGGFGAGGFPAGMMGMMLGFMLLGIPLGWVASFLMSGLLCLLVLPATALSIRAFGVQPAQDTTGKVAGSAVALAGSIGSFINPLETASGLSTQAAAVIGMGAWLLISLAISLAACQSGGCLASLGDLRRRRLGRLKTQEAWRLTTWALLAITAIVSVLLALLKVAGLLTSPLAICLTLGALLAYGLHHPVAWATNKWLDWRLKKRRRKRADRRITPPATREAASS